MSSLDWLPGAARDLHGARLSWASTARPKACLHSTESSGWPTYRGWSELPHATILPDPGVGVIVRQHLPFSQAGMALAHPAGTPETNRAMVLQFELVGTCDPAGPRGAYFWPAADDVVLADLYAKVVEPVSVGFGVPLVALPFTAYPASAGQNPGRLSWAAWAAYSGWLGHQHVPGNDHGDPGAFPWSRLLALGGTDMGPVDLTDAAIIKIADVVATRYKVRLADGSLTTRDDALGRDLLLDQQAAAAVTKLQGSVDALQAALSRPVQVSVDVQALAGAVVAALPPTGGLTAAQVTEACRAGVAAALRSVPA